MNADIIIVGGGPIGLYAGISLTKAGFKCLILEKRNSPISDSRSLGIHPVSLQMFDELSIVEPFLKNGLKISEGLARNKHESWGAIKFSKLESRYNFILAIPQFQTEKILETEFLKLNPEGLVRNAEVSHITQLDHQVIATYKHDGDLHEISAPFLIGCDGKNSFVRQHAGIFFGGKRYPDTYIMGDFTDNTSFHKKAVVYLTKQGMIECFPLPNGMRRWVVKTNEYIAKPSQTILSDLVQQRIGVSLSQINCSMLSTFGVQHFMAESFAKNRIILLGDSAHVVSPIGGQGMNLGWIGARNFTETMKKIQSDYSNKEYFLRNFEKEHTTIVRKVALRAEINMKIGRRTPFLFAKKMLVKLMLSPVFVKTTVRMFTMHGLLK